MNDIISKEAKSGRYHNLEDGISIQVRYTEDGQPCPNYIPKNQYFKRLAAYETLITELRECIERAALSRNIYVG